MSRVRLGAARARFLVTAKRGLYAHGGIVVKLVIQISKGLIRDQHARRWTMFYALLAAMLMLFTGAVIIDRWLRDHLLLLFVWWAACAWLTLLAVLLALFDMLVIRAAARRDRRRLEREFLRKEAGESPHEDPR